MADGNKDKEILELKKKIQELENKSPKKMNKTFFLVFLVILFFIVGILFLNKNKNKTETVKENTDLSGISIEGPKNNETTADEDEEITDVAPEKPQYQSTIELNEYETWASSHPYMPNCRGPREAYFDENTGTGKIKYTRCVFNPDTLKNNSGDPKDEYLWLTIKFPNLTKEHFDSLKNSEFTFFDPDNVINQVEGSFYEYSGAWITNQEITNINYESFKALKF